VERRTRSLSVPVFRIQSSTVTTAICISGWYEAKNQHTFVAATAVAQLQHLQPGHSSSPVSVPESRPPLRLRDTPETPPARIRPRHIQARRYAGRRSAPSVGLWPSQVVSRVRQRQRTIHIRPRKTSQFPTPIWRPQGSHTDQTAELGKDAKRWNCTKGRWRGLWPERLRKTRAAIPET
jgi:hypothetical protein